MRILFISDNFPPEVNAPATRTYEHALKWVEEGHTVTVITCAPNFPKGEVYKGYRNQLLSKEEIDGIKVIRVWSYISANEGFVRRTLDYLSFAFTSFWAGLFQKCDVIIATSPQFFTTWSGWLLSKFKAKPWVFELRDLWPESIKAVGALEDGTLYRGLESIELRLYKSAALVVSLTHSFKNNLVARGIPDDKIVVVPNGSNLALFNPQTDGKAVRERLGIQDKFIVGYIGTHGMAHGLDFILDSIQELTDPDIHFLFIGDGAEKDNLLLQVEQLNLGNVTFIDSIPKEKIPGYLAAIDVSLVPLRKSDTFKTVIPSKIFEAAAMKKPVLLGVEGEAAELVQKFEAGVIFEPENREDFLNKLMLLKQDRDLYLRTAENGTRLADQYDREKLAVKMLDELKKII